MTIKKFFKTDEEIEMDILGNFTRELLIEVEKQISKYGKDEFFKRLKKQN